MRVMITHPLEPVFDARSRVLILGTMPSPQSRQRGFYYAHPQNRFWRVLFSLLNEPFSEDTEARRSLCLNHGIALWDVLKSCSIEGASDASIRDAVPNDIAALVGKTGIRAVFTTGKTAGRAYSRLCEADIALPAVTLPSPSPANCAVKLPELIESYRAIMPYLF